MFGADERVTNTVKTEPAVSSYGKILWNPDRAPPRPGETSSRPAWKGVINHPAGPARRVAAPAKTACSFFARAGLEPGRMVTGAVNMASVEQMTDEQFERYALEVLQRELGADGLARFLRLNRSGKGNYTLDRMQWQKDLSVADIVASPDRPRSQ